MPNIWTKSAQKLAEAFAGPRTKDVEFDKLVEEMKLLEKGVNEFRNLLKNFQTYTSGIRNLAKEIKSSLSHIYGKSDDYDRIQEIVVDFHSQIDSSYIDLVDNVNKVYLKTTEWNNDFLSVKLLLDKREEARKDYDHYDEKLEKIYKSREEKLRKGENITAKEVEYYERVSKSLVIFSRTKKNTRFQLTIILQHAIELMN